MNVVRIITGTEIGSVCTGRIPAPAGFTAPIVPIRAAAASVRISIDKPQKADCFFHSQLFSCLAA